MINLPLIRASLNFVPSNDITNGLIAWYRLDGDATDSTNNGHNGTLQNSPIFAIGQNGVGNDALTFVGASSQYVSCGTNLGLTGNTNLTLSVWFYIATNTQHGALIKIGNSTDASGGDGFAFGIGGSGSNGFESVGNNLVALFEGIRWIDSGSLAGTGWHHFVLVIDSSGFPHMYFDGTLIYSDTGSSATNIGTRGTSMAQIGGYLASNSSSRYFTGTIDDVRFYNRALTGTEVSLIHSNGAK